MRDLVRGEYDDESDDDGGEEEDADGEEHLATAQFNDGTGDDRCPRPVVDIVIVVHALHHYHLRLHARSSCAAALPTLAPALNVEDIRPGGSG